MRTRRRHLLLLSALILTLLAPGAPVGVATALTAVPGRLGPGPGAHAAPGRGAAALPATRWGVASSHDLSQAPARLRDLGARWAYDWSAQAPAPTPGLEWVPMVWGAASITPGTLAALTHARQEGRAVDLLGFNEPDSAGQAHMTPQGAADLWPALERTGLRLGSPAPAVPTDGWLARFMTLAHQRHLRVDFLALHYYQDFTNPDAVTQLRQQLISLHQRYRLPIWITEIGALDIARWGEPMQARATAARALSYLRRLVPMLDGLGFVERVAWFTDSCERDPGCRASSLQDGGGQPTALGRGFRRLVG